MEKRVETEVQKVEEKKEVTLKDLITRAKERKTKAKGFGHVGYAKKTLRKIRKEVGKEEFKGLGPGAAFYVVCELMKKENPNLWKLVQEKVGLKRYRNEVSVQFYDIRDTIDEK